MFDIQQAAVLALVAVALFAVVRAGARTLRGEKTGCSCGGCGKSRVQKWMRAHQSGRR